MSELNPELLGKQLWEQTHAEIEECEDNYDDDGNCRYSEQAFIEIFQQIKDMEEGKIPKMTWDEAAVEIQKWIDEETADEESEELDVDKNRTAIFG